MTVKAVEISKVSTKGGFYLLWGIVISTVVSAVGVIILARILQPQAYGLYTITLAAPNLIGTFRDWGMNSAIVKYTAQYSAEENEERVREILLAGLVFEIILGLGLSFLSFLLSGFIAADIFKRPISVLIQVSSFTILAGAFLNAAQAAFTGREQMQPSSVTLVFQALFRSVLSPVLVYLGFGVSGAVVGYAAGMLGGGLVGFVLMLGIYKSLRKKNVFTEPLEVWKTMKFMFRYALPLSFSNIFVTFLTQFYNFIIAIYASNFLIGNYAVANNFTVLLAFFATPIATMLFPAFSKLNADEDKETLKIVFKGSIKYSTLLLIPPTVAVIALGTPLVSTLFGTKYASAPMFLALLATQYLLTAFGSLSAGELISGQGKTRLYLELALVTMAIGVPLAILLVPTLHVVGLIITMIFDGIPALVVSLYWIKKHYEASVDWVSSAKILFSSAAAGALAYFAVSFISLGNWAKLITGLIVFAAGFLLIAIVTRTLRKPDIDSLRLVTSGIGPIGGIINKILKILERIVNALSIT